MKERLDKIISSRCLLTRTEAAKAIKRGRVTVDGKVCVICDDKFDVTENIIAFDGNKVKRTPYVYIMMNKPEGVLSATEDKNCATVLDFLPEEYARRGLGVVGRLDKDATGLLLLTDDGQLNHRLTSPKSHLPKLYRVTTDKEPGQEHIEVFASGMDLGDFTAKPAKLILGEGESFVEISEGKFHQVKRMYEKIGLRVLTLKRLKIGNLELDYSLAPGEYRLLTEDEERQIGAF